MTEADTGGLNGVGVVPVGSLTSSAWPTLRPEKEPRVSSWGLVGWKEGLVKLASPSSKEAAGFRDVIPI